MKKTIETTQSTEILDTPRLKVFKDDIVFPSGKSGVHWVVDYARNGVGVLPLIEEGKFILGLHHRYTTQKWGWEIVAGSVEPGEEIQQTAHREIKEETGYTAGSLEFLFTYNPAPGLGNETFHTYIARDLKKIETPLDTDEVAEIKIATWEDCQKMIQNGEMQDGFSITLLSYCKAIRII